MQYNSGFNIFYIRTTHLIHILLHLPFVVLRERIILWVSLARESLYTFSPSFTIVAAYHTLYNTVIIPDSLRSRNRSRFRRHEHQHFYPSFSLFPDIVQSTPSEAKRVAVEKRRERNTKKMATTSIINVIDYASIIIISEELLIHDPRIHYFGKDVFHSLSRMSPFWKNLNRVP